jgi:hypothetical protein
LAVASGLSALALFGVGAAPTVPTITVPPTGNGRSSTAVVRRSPVGRADRTRVGPVPCTTPARALLEAAAYVALAILAPRASEHAAALALISALRKREPDVPVLLLADLSEDPASSQLQKSARRMHTEPRS